MPAPGASLKGAQAYLSRWGLAQYDSGASLSVRAKQSARRRSKTYILLLLTNLLHRSSARQRRDETRAGPFRPTLTGAIPRPSVDFSAIRTGHRTRTLI